MKRATFVIVVVGAIASNVVASAAEPCMHPSEKVAFDVVGLQNRLMVAALTCEREDAYNEIVPRLRGEFNGARLAVRAFFSRNYVTGGNRRNDDYVTKLSNATSEESTKEGEGYCDGSAHVLDEVKTLRKTSDLRRYASEHTVPLGFDACAVAPSARRR